MQPVDGSLDDVDVDLMPKRMPVRNRKLINQENRRLQAAGGFLEKIGWPSLATYLSEVYYFGAVTLAIPIMLGVVEEVESNGDKLGTNREAHVPELATQTSRHRIVLLHCVDGVVASVGCFILGQPGV